MAALVGAGQLLNRSTDLVQLTVERLKIIDQRMKAIAGIGDKPIGITDILQNHIGTGTGTVDQRYHLINPRIDLDRRRTDFLRQVAHLVGDHGKAATGFSRTGRFNGGIQRQQIGLFGEPLHQRQDVNDTGRVVCQLLHHLLEFAHPRFYCRHLLTDSLQFSGGLPNLAQVVAVARGNRLGMAGNIFDGGSGLLTGLEHCLRLGNLLLCRMLRLEHHLLQLTGVERHLHTALTGIGNHLLETAGKLIVAVRHASNFIVTLRRQRSGNITVLVLYGTQHLSHAVDRLEKQMTHEKQGKQCRRQGDHQHDRRQQTGGRGKLGHPLLSIGQSAQQGIELMHGCEQPIVQADQHQAGEDQEQNIAKDFAGQGMKEGFLDTPIETHRANTLLLLSGKRSESRVADKNPLRTKRVMPITLTDNPKATPCGRKCVSLLWPRL